MKHLGGWGAGREGAAPGNESRLAWWGPREETGSPRAAGRTQGLVTCQIHSRKDLKENSTSSHREVAAELSWTGAVRATTGLGHSSRADIRGEEEGRVQGPRGEVAAM